MSERNRTYTVVQAGVIRCIQTLLFPATLPVLPKHAAKISCSAEKLPRATGRFFLEISGQVPIGFRPARHLHHRQRRSLPPR